MTSGKELDDKDLGKRMDGGYGAHKGVACR